MLLHILHIIPQSHPTISINYLTIYYTLIHCNGVWLHVNIITYTNRPYRNVTWYTMYDPFALQILTFLIIQPVQFHC